MTANIFRFFSSSAALLIFGSSALALQNPSASKKTAPVPATPTAAASVADPLLHSMQQELQRAYSSLRKSDAPANGAKPYFISYSVVDQRGLSIVAAEGAIYTSVTAHRRDADVTVRVGTPELDNTDGKDDYSGITSGTLPLQDDSAAIARTLWQLTDRQYKKASAAFLKVQAATEVRGKQDDDSGDFATEAREVRVAPLGTRLEIDQNALDELVRKISAEFRKYPQVLSSVVVLQADDMQHYFVSSEGTESCQPEKMIRMMIQGEAQTGDGMKLMRVETFLAPSVDKLPTMDVFSAKVAGIAKDLANLKTAPPAEPFSGPALLSGRAAAVFFHEVLGHRLEGQRQRGDEEGQTFTKQVGKLVLPDFLSVVDDPTLRELNGEDLAGYYSTDEEGQPAEPVTLIKDGILKNFLMSRMPIKNFDTSNGHGRAQPGYMPVGRQGNLIVESSHELPDAQLRQKFIEEIKKQNKPYGLYFEDIQGGFTLTTRELPQAFQVIPVMVWKVFPDGRPDELVRGVDIVGTPLNALEHIVATGNQQFVFNGICGAESGDIPVSAAAPAMLFSEIEVQRKKQDHELPPLLPPPPEQIGGQSTTAQVQR